MVKSEVMVTIEVRSFTKSLPLMVVPELELEFEEEPEELEEDCKQ